MIRIQKSKTFPTKCIHVGTSLFLLGAASTSVGCATTNYYLPEKASYEEREDLAESTSICGLYANVGAVTSLGIMGLGLGFMGFSLLELRLGQDPQAAFGTALTGVAVSGVGMGLALTFAGTALQYDGMAKNIIDGSNAGCRLPVSVNYMEKREQERRRRE